MHVMLKHLFCIIAVISLALGCAMWRDWQRPKTTLAIHMQVTENMPTLRTMPVIVEQPPREFIVSSFPVVTHRDVRSAALEETPGGNALRLNFDERGKFRLDAETTANRGRHLVVLINQKPVVANLITDRITNGTYLVEANIPDEELERIVNDLNKEAAK
jgi:hypothetical protein